MSQPSAAGDYALFLRKFLEKGRTISSAVPSSRTMALKLLEEIDFSRPGVILELGAGTGAVTEHIVERLRPHHRFVAVENDADFVEILRRRFPTQMILQADATRLSEPLASFGVHRVKYVVSCLPTPALSKRGIVRLAQWAERSMDGDGAFLQLTVVPLLYRGFYRRLFEQVNFRMVWRNIPPGGVYCCRRPRISRRDAEVSAGA
jgi:phospholipid N-methyltransferase